MKLFATILQNDLAGNLRVPCGSDSYIQIDARLSKCNAENIAIDHFIKVKPNYTNIVLFKAYTVADKNIRIVSIFGKRLDHTTARNIITMGAYK